MIKNNEMKSGRVDYESPDIVFVSEIGEKAILDASIGIQDATEDDTYNNFFGN